MSKQPRKRIGFLVYEGVTALDLVGPAEAFAVAHRRDAAGESHPCYEVVVVGVGTGRFTSESGVTLGAAVSLRDCGPLDTVVIPGGAGLREPAINTAVVDWLKRRAPKLRRIASVCTGLYALAPTGLLDGGVATTHWSFAADVSRRFPAIKVDANRIFVQHGKCYTSAGITAGIDLAIALIQEDFGPDVALGVARELVMYVQRPGGQEQFSQPLQFQVAAKDSLAELVAWVAAHLEADLSIESLARRASMSPRHLSRRFRERFGMSVARFVEQLRLDEARTRLTGTSETVDRIALSVGFRSDDAFRRAFERRFDVSPTAYRRHFARAAAG